MIILICILLLIWAVLNFLAGIYLIEEVEKYGVKSIFKDVPIYAYLVFLPALILCSILGFVPYRSKK